MTRTLRSALVVSLIAAGSASVAAAEGVAITPAFNPGTTMSYELGFTLERGLVQGAGKDRLVQEAGLDLRITDVSDAGVATVTGDITWLVIDLDRSAFRVRVDTREQMGDAGNLAEETMRELVDLYLDAELTLLVAADGTIQSISGFEPIIERIAGENGSLARLASGRLMPETLASDLQPIWNGSGAAGQTLDSGDTWTETRNSPLGAGVTMDLSTVWSVSAVSEDAVVFGGPVTAEVIMPELDTPMPVSFEVTEQSGTAAAEWDPSRGVLVRRSAETSYTVTVAVNDESQSSTRSGKSTLELVDHTPGS